MGPHFLEMKHQSPSSVTGLLKAWGGGDHEALEKLVPLVNAELRRLARRYMGQEPAGHTLQPTALINEVYLRLIDWRGVRWQERAHFFGVSARLMRRTLVDHARRHRTTKRGGQSITLTFDEATVVPQERGADLIAIDDALNILATQDPRKSQIVELRFFGRADGRRNGGSIEDLSANGEARMESGASVAVL
jgi:RNA polymerase sigma factor (TIGR02999 family)